MTSRKTLFSSIAHVALCLGLFAGNSQTSYAGTKTASFTVQVRVMSSCQIQWSRIVGTQVQLNQECTANIWQLNSAATFEKTAVSTSIDF